MADAYKLNGAEWRNRIVKFGMVRVDDLLPHENNYRVHPKAQQNVMAGVLDDVGWVDAVKINMRTDPSWGADQNVHTLLDGHLRGTLANRKGADEIPALWVDLLPHEEAEILATFDPIAAMATHDAELLDAVLRDVETGDEHVQAMLAELAADSGTVPPDVEFPEYDESIADDVEMCTCPKCGHEFPK